MKLIEIGFMKTYTYPSNEEWDEILSRPSSDLSSIEKKVRKILEKVKEKGDKAIIKYTKKFDGAELDKIEVSDQEIKEAVKLVPNELKEAIEQAASNIKSFHNFQLQATEWIVTTPGIICSRKMVPIEKVGLYIPGGTAPLFSTVLMLGIPAKIAGCRDIILCTPPMEDGQIHPAILFAAQLTGINKIFKAGGVQAIAAMAYGTETIPAVYKIFGPGNQFVNFAKQVIQQEGVAIDLPAGPSEICILADETAHPAFVAADLLSQAEHGKDSHLLLISTDIQLVNEVRLEIEKQIESLNREKIARQVLENSSLVVVKDIVEGIHMVNKYAPEHLIIVCSNEDVIAERITNAGSVFIGNYSPEAAGDYASGTNHTLPTNGFARSYSGVSVDSFVKKITYQKLSPEGLKNIAQTVITMAEAEGLDAHANAVRVRGVSSEL